MKTLHFILLACLFSSPAFAEETFKLTPAVGFGTSTLSMTDGAGATYTPTNTNFYFLGLSTPWIALQAKVPNKDPKESIQSRVDTQIQDYQIAFDIHENWKGAVSYQDYKGYYLDDKNSIHRGISDLHFNHVGTQVYYLFNEKHSSFLIQDTFWNETENSGSWVLNSGSINLL